MDGWHSPQTSASHFRENYPEPSNAGTDCRKTAPNRQPSKLAARSLYILKDTPGSPPQCRCCDEGFEGEEGQKNKARADVHLARGSHEHGWTFALLRCAALYRT